MAELPGNRAVVSMRLKILHGKVDHASQWGVRGKSLEGGPEYSSRGKREVDEGIGGCQHTIAGKIPKIESGR